MEGEFFFNNGGSNVLFWIRCMRRLYIIDLINFCSNRRRSHYKETFNNLNWMSWRFCYFFILNNFIRDNWCQYILRNNTLWGVGFSLGIIYLFLHNKISIYISLELEWILNKTHEIMHITIFYHTLNSIFSITII